VSGYVSVGLRAGFQALLAGRVLVSTDALEIPGLWTYVYAIVGGALDFVGCLRFRRLDLSGANLSFDTPAVPWHGHAVH
jgi:hypothetical protein